MKKMLFGALAMAALVGCTLQPKYTISGQVADLEGTMYLIEDEQVIDSVEVKEGAFTLKGELNGPKIVTVANNVNPRAAQVGARFVAEEGELVLESVDQGYRVVGSPSNDASNAYGDAARALMQEFYAEGTTDERRAAIEEEYAALSENALLDNTDNFFGVSMLMNASYNKSAEEMEELVALFSPEMQETELMGQVKAQLEKKLRTAVGQPYIPFEQADKDGNAVTMQSIIENPANKYVLIDFWASWCGPCMAEVPALKAAYDAYHKKGFEIFGVSLDNNKEAWLAAIENKELNWPHVSDLQGWKNAAADLYGVRSIPANFLIDCATGQIVATGLRGEEVKTKVAELLK